MEPGERPSQSVFTYEPVTTLCVSDHAESSTNDSLWLHLELHFAFPPTSLSPSIQHVFIIVFSLTVFLWSLTSTAGSFPLPLPQTQSLLSGVGRNGGCLWPPGPGGKVQALQGPSYPAGGLGDGAGPATAEPGCPVALAACQNFNLSH